MRAPLHVVMFSSGAGSWAAARRVADAHGTDGLVLLFADVAGRSNDPHIGEDGDNYRFLHEAAADIGGELVVVADGRTIWDVFRDKRFLGNSRLANCSALLKQEPSRRWLAEHADPAITTLHVGIGWDETHRLPAIERGWAPYRVTAPMTEAPYLDRDQVLAALRARGIEPPRLYELGFAHANCGGGCVKAGQGQFVHLLRTMPDRFATWEREEAALRDHLGKDVSILRDRTGGTSTPLTLADLREREASRPEQLDLLDLGGCGCFVEHEEPPAEQTSTADRAELAARARAATLAGNAAHLAGVPTDVDRIRADLRTQMRAEYDRLILGDPDAPPIRLVGILGGGPA